MCCNCWAGTGDQSIHFSHVCRETTYKLRLYLSYNSSQVWPTRISGVIESVFRCSRPNSKSTVTLTRPMQRKNASLHLLPLSPALLPLATLILIIVKQKSAQGARSLRQMQFHSMPNGQRPEIFLRFRRYTSPPCTFCLYETMACKILAIVSKSLHLGFI